MKNSFKIDIFISLLLLVSTILILNPYNFLMPDMLQILVIVITLVVFAFFAIFVLREKNRDERDAVHRSISGRVAFLSGSSILIIGIIYQALHDSIDVWLVIALVVMVISKLVSRFYSGYYK